MIFFSFFFFLEKLSSLEQKMEGNSFMRLDYPMVFENNWFFVFIL